MPEQKPKHGGPRVGAGRKRKLPPIAPPADKDVAAKILASIDEVVFWQQLLTAKDLRLRFEAGRYLTDKRDGKPKQAVEMSGSLVFETLAERLAKARQRKNAGE